MATRLREDEQCVLHTGLLGGSSLDTETNRGHRRGRRPPEILPDVDWARQRAAALYPADRHRMTSPVRISSVGEHMSSTTEHPVQWPADDFVPTEELARRQASTRTQPDPCESDEECACLLHQRPYSFRPATVWNETQTQTHAPLRGRPPPVNDAWVVACLRRHPRTSPRDAQHQGLCRFRRGSRTRPLRILAVEGLVERTGRPSETHDANSKPRLAPEGAGDHDSYRSPEAGAQVRNPAGGTVRGSRRRPHPEDHALVSCPSSEYEDDAYSWTAVVARSRARPRDRVGPMLPTGMARILLISR